MTGSLASQSCPRLRNTPFWDLPYCLVFQKKFIPPYRAQRPFLHMGASVKQHKEVHVVLRSISNLISNGYLQFIVLHLHVTLLELCLKKKKKEKRKHGHTSSVSFMSARASHYPKPLKHPKGLISCGRGRFGGKKKAQPLSQKE